jgi:hypothetical protein
MPSRRRIFAADACPGWEGLVRSPPSSRHRPCGWGLGARAQAAAGAMVVAGAVAALVVALLRAATGLSL